MKRADLEHLIRAAATIADDDELIVVGSQAVLAQYPDAPEEMLRSDEADIYPKNKPERWELIDGSIGELSTFHDTFGYYAQGVQEGVATLPAGWQERLILLSNQATRGATGFCLELHDGWIGGLALRGRPPQLAIDPDHEKSESAPADGGHDGRGGVCR